MEEMASGGRGRSANLKGEGARSRQQAAAATTPYNWYDPAPVNCRFPWMNLNLPWIPCEPDVFYAADVMKKEGNKSFKSGDHFDALWKYTHSFTLLDFIKMARAERDVCWAVLSSNIAACCLKLGDDDRIDLLHSLDSLPVHKTMWYWHAHQHAHLALTLKPDPKIAWKAYRRRGESFKKTLALYGTPNAMQILLPPLSDPYAMIIGDYVESCRLQNPPDHKIYYDTVLLAVDKGLTSLLLTLNDSHVKNGFTTKLLEESISNCSTKLKHVEYLMFDMGIESSIKPQFDASGLSATSLLRRKMFSLELFRELIECGLVITGEDIDVAVNLLPVGKLKLFQLLISNFPMEGGQALQSACTSAERLSKQSFLELIRNHSANLYAILKKEGNSLFSRGDYEQALDKYCQALKYCNEHKMTKEMSLLRANCAQACLKLQLYRDAYSHSSECVRLDESNHKGYYRRAESRKALIPTTSDYGSFTDMVKDYLKCHDLQPSFEVFSQAVVTAVNHDCLDLIPKISYRGMLSGFSSDFFKHLVTNHTLTEKLLHFVVISLPDSRSVVEPYNASCVDLGTILQITTKGCIIKRLLRCGMKIKEGDIVAAVKQLQDSQVDVLEAILTLSNGSINLACNEALRQRKKNFVTFLLKKKRATRVVTQTRSARSGTVTATSTFTLPQEQLWGGPSVGDPVVLRSTQLVMNASAGIQAGKEKEEKKVSLDGMSVHELKEKAKECFKRGEMKSVMKCFNDVLKLCELSDEVPFIQNQLARLSIVTEDYCSAFMHSSTSIGLCLNNPKAYFLRAQAISCAHKAGKSIPGCSLVSAIHDYKTAYHLKKDFSVLKEALLIAKEKEEMRLLSNECKQLPAKKCVKLLGLLLNHQDCKTPLLSHLLLEIWRDRTFSCSGVKLKVLLEDKGLTDEKLLARFFDLKVSVSVEDVRLAMRCLSPADINVLKLLCAKCVELDVNAMYNEALSLGKVAFSLHFVESGAIPGKELENFMIALKKKNFHTAKLLVEVIDKDVFGSVELGHLFDTTDLLMDVELIRLLVQAGVKLCGTGPLIPMVMKTPLLKLEDKIEVVCILVENGVECKQLCLTAQRSTTPLHVATELAIKSGGVTKLIETVAVSPSFEKLKKPVNDKMETPLHLAVKPHIKKDLSTAVLKCLLQTGAIDPSARNKDNKRPRDCLKAKDDQRVKLLDDAVTLFNPPDIPAKKKSTKKKKEDSKKPCTQPVDRSPADRPPKKDEPKPKDFNYSDLSLDDKLKYQLRRIYKEDASYFMESEDQDANVQEPDIQVRDAGNIQQSPRIPVSAVEPPPSRADSSPDMYSGPAVPNEPVAVGSRSGKFSLEDLNFDNLPWEVEVTRNVVKFFKNTKRYSPKDRISAARVIYGIAEGKRNLNNAKPVGNGLYEAHIDKAGRILWEKAINFSQQHTDEMKQHTGKSDFPPVYSQVIRVWEVILDHDNLNRQIKECADQITQSYNRGKLSSVRCGLKHLFDGKMPKRDNFPGKEKLDLPFMYKEDSSLTKPEHHFVPVASTNKSEYSVTTFYSFDTMNMMSMITGSNEKRDYPFKGWHEENEIIRINSKEAILLLGRSGTGKTTCCLYRLWNEFKNYWNPDSNTYGMKIPRKTLISVSPDIELPSPADSKESFHDDTLKEEEVGAESPLSSESPTLNCKQTSSPDGAAEVIEEDLHQVFVTKNYVLCDRMRKHFFCMAAGCDFLESHLPFEEEAPPNSFSKYNNLSFPAFLTARQFYIQLDNSLGDNETFFERNRDGNLQVKISSLDYDHEDSDTLLDLEQSDSEDEDADAIDGYPTASATLHATPRHHWTEVTALYFKEIIWPKISHGFGKDFDPMLVWLEIQSFIKGSEIAVEKGAPLSLSEYLDFGNRMAPNFSDHRDKIYELYKKYRQFVRKCRHSNFLFDECDLVLNLHNRLKKTKDIPWSVHSVYIDEVQDFTQAELAIFICCCRDPNSMFFTGDTAQSIMRGIAFRFQDLRSCFHSINIKVPYINVPKEPLKLTINYRSHCGILKLAGSIIDLIRGFFKDSIDHLPDDKGMFPGPMPVFLDSCKEEDLSLLLSTNKRECTVIEFGAHQVILVQSKEAKDKLPDILKGAIILTIFEAKGLEFDDVLLYNFFTDSLVDEKTWRVVTSYLEMSYNRNKIENEQPLSGQPRSVSFDPALHKSLNSELKYLYTAITRAKCNLWIYDADMKNRLPMLDYWHKRNAVKVVTPLQSTASVTRTQSAEDYSSEQNDNLVFASISTPEQWRAQGDNMRKRHLWEQAILCYEKAGQEYTYLAKEAQAYHRIQSARLHRPHLFQSAALNFVERDELKHSVRCLNNAALCLKNSRPVLAAELFEKLGNLTKAAQCFLRGRDLKNFARIQESLGEYNSVIRVFHGKPFMKKREALAKAVEYESKGCMLDPKFTPSELSFSCAKFYCERRDKTVLLEVLKCMPEHERRVKFLKEAGLFKEAFDDYASCDQHSAYRLALARGLFDEAIELAKRGDDKMTEDKFILWRAKHEYLSLNRDFNVSDVSSEVIGNLKRVTSSEEKLLQAEANLLLGMLTKAQSHCLVAKGLFQAEKHKAGTLEAFDQVGEFGKISDQDILDCAHIAKKVSTSLRNSSDINIDVKQAVKFCGLQLRGTVYVTSEFCNVWIPLNSLLKYQCGDVKGDIDGMLCLRHEIRDKMAEHYAGFIKKWVAKFKLESRVQRRLSVFNLHRQLKKCSLDRWYSLQEVSSLSLREYLQACVNWLELQSLRDAPTNNIVTQIVSIFSPQVYIYLPQCLNSQHVQTVRRSVNSRQCFTTYMEHNISSMQKLPEATTNKVQIDEWLLAWRASCIALPSMKLLDEKTLSLESEVDDMKKGGGKYTPPGFIFWESEKRFRHVFSFWLSSCKDIREHSRVLWAARLAITHFLGNVFEDKRISISVMSCVDILTVHCTSLLAMITNCNALQKFPTPFTVPLMYKHMVEIFSCMNCRERTPDKNLMAACVEQVSSYRHLNDLFNRCKLLLIKAMGYLIGAHRRSPRSSILSSGLWNHPDSAATRLCLILTFTLLGNMAMLKVRELKEFEERIFNILKDAASRNVPDYIKEVYHGVCANSRLSNPAFVFSLVANLLHRSRMESTLTRLTFKQKSGSRGHIEFENCQPTSSQVKNLPSEKSPDARARPAVSAPQKNVLPFKKVPAPISPALPAKAAPVGMASSQLGQGSSHDDTTSGASRPLDPLPTNTPTTSTLNPNASPYLLLDRAVESSLAFPSSNLPGIGTGAASAGIPEDGTSVDSPTLPPPGYSFQQGVVNNYIPEEGTSVDPPVLVSSSSEYLSYGSNNDITPGTRSYNPVNQPLHNPMLYQANIQEHPHVFTAPPPPHLPPFHLPPPHLPPPHLPPPPPGIYSIPLPPLGYYFTDDAFSYAGPPDEMESEGELVEYEEENYALTQQSRAVSIIDPTMVEDGIIDSGNHFCNVCGIRYRGDEPVDYYGDQEHLQSYHEHVSGTVHCDNTVSFKRFKLLTDCPAEGYELTWVQLAEKKLEELKDKGLVDVETEALDQEIEGLQKEINKYHEAVSDFHDNRQWCVGIDRISSMHSTLSHRLVTATKLANQLAEVSKQRSFPEELEEEDEFEVEELMDQDLPLNNSEEGKKKSAAIRTAKGKERSRDKKRKK